MLPRDLEFDVDFVIDDNAIVCISGWFNDKTRKEINMHISKELDLCRLHQS